MDADLTAYVAQGGLLADLCGTGQGDAEPGQDCPVCRLTEVGLHSAPACPWTIKSHALTQTLQRVAQARHHAKPLDPTQHSRAPPIC